MTSIRPYRASDFEMLKSWWGYHGFNELAPDSLPEETTFILEKDGTPVLSICLFLMNCREAAMMEHLVSAPDFCGEERRNAVDKIFSHAESEAKKLGYKAIVLFSYEPKLKERYEALGYTKTLDNVTTFSKRI